MTEPDSRPGVLDCDYFFFGTPGLSSLRNRMPFFKRRLNLGEGEGSGADFSTKRFHLAEGSDHDARARGMTVYFFRSLTPGLSSLRNSTPAFSRTATILPRVSVRALTGPSNPSMRRIVPRATLDRLDSSACAQPRRARTARICLPVIVVNPRRYHEETCNPKHLSILEHNLRQPSWGPFSLNCQHSQDRAGFRIAITLNAAWLVPIRLIVARYSE